MQCMKGNDPSGCVWKAPTIGDTPIVHWTMILGRRATPNEVCEKWIKTTSKCKPKLLNLPDAVISNHPSRTKRNVTNQLFCWNRSCKSNYTPDIRKLAWHWKSPIFKIGNTSSNGGFSGTIFLILAIFGVQVWLLCKISSFIFQKEKDKNRVCHCSYATGQLGSSGKQSTVCWLRFVWSWWSMFVQMIFASCLWTTFFQDPLKT